MRHVPCLFAENLRLIPPESLMWIDIDLSREQVHLTGEGERAGRVQGAGTSVSEGRGRGREREPVCQVGEGTGCREREPVCQAGKGQGAGEELVVYLVICR